MYAANVVEDCIVIWYGGLRLRPGVNYRNKLGGLFSYAVLLSNGRELFGGFGGWFPKACWLEKGKGKKAG